MEFHEAWERALKETEIIRSRVLSLPTYDDAHVPYLFLSPSTLNYGDTVVRRGKIMVQRPALMLPPNIPQLEGFDLQKNEGETDHSVFSFLLVRGITVPSLKYNNQTHSLDIFEGDVRKAAAYFANQMEREEDVATGLLLGHEDVWQFSVLIFICSQIARNTEVDLKRLMDDFRRREGA
ncbi:MAG: hypothetical protein HQL22_12295 [Candidatus Omnitrophica bacterium]|nr:hypothetical protein [Candidatus Omnitrophota bacterium]